MNYKLKYCIKAMTQTINIKIATMNSNYNHSLLHAFTSDEGE